jgi:hypothetical protein
MCVPADAVDPHAAAQDGGRADSAMANALQRERDQGGDDERVTIFRSLATALLHWLA